MKDLTIGILRTLGIIIVVAGLLLGVCYLNRDKTVSAQTLDLPITSEDRYRSFMSAEQTVFVVEWDNMMYTLPAVDSADVRMYHVDDTIPVRVIEYESGRINLHVDMTAVLQTSKMNSQDSQTSESI